MALIRKLGMGSLISLLMLTSGCAWYSSLTPVAQNRDDMMDSRSPGDENPEMAHFYELQMRIDALEAQLGHKPTASNVSVTSEKSNESTFDSLLRYVHEQTRAAIALIDDVLDRLEHSDGDGFSQSAPRAELAQDSQSAAVIERGQPHDLSSSQDELHEVDLPQDNVAAIAGTLERNPQGQVVASTTDGNRYNYSVVYVYPQIQPWFDMWALLEQNGVQDKWRGQNPEKQTYFIYVGAYYTERPARKRSRALQLLTGDQPEIRIRDGYHAVAMQ